MGAYSKLKIKTSNNTVDVTFNEETIKVKQYLPIEEKLDLIGKVISMSADDNRFYNVGKLEIFLALEVMYHYTDLTFTDSKKEKVTELYDEFITSGLYDLVFQAIPLEEMSWIRNVMKETVKSIYEYQNSIFGIMDALKTDWSNLGLEAPKIQEALSNPENLELVKDILTKLG